MFDVGDEQFLVLLFMLHPEDENRLDFIEQLFASIGEQIVDARIDRCSVALGLANGWPRDQSTQVAPVHVAGSVVVRVKEICVLRNFRAIFCNKIFKDKRLEKPSRMRQVPLRRTDVGHRLHHTIFRFKTDAQRIGKASDLMKTMTQVFDFGFARQQNRLPGHRSVSGSLN